MAAIEHPLKSEKGYEVVRDDTGGRRVVRLLWVDPRTGLRLQLTFPVEAPADLARFKERLVTMTLNKQSKGQGTA